MRRDDLPPALRWRLGARIEGAPEPAIRRFDELHIYIRKPIPGPDGGPPLMRAFYVVRSYGSTPEQLHADLGPRAERMQERLAARLPEWGQPRGAFVTALREEGFHGEERAVFGVDLEVRWSLVCASLLLFLACSLLCGFADPWVRADRSGRPDRTRIRSSTTAKLSSLTSPSAGSPPGYRGLLTTDSATTLTCRGLGRERPIPS